MLEGNSDGLPPDLDRKVGETDKDRQTAKIKITAAKPRPHILFILADDLGELPRMRRPLKSISGHCMRPCERTGSNFERFRPAVRCSKLHPSILHFSEI